MLTSLHFVNSSLVGRTRQARPNIVETSPVLCEWVTLLLLLMLMVLLEVVPATPADRPPFAATIVPLCVINFRLLAVADVCILPWCECEWWYIRCREYWCWAASKSVTDAVSPVFVIFERTILCILPYLLLDLMSGRMAIVLLDDDAERCCEEWWWDGSDGITTVAVDNLWLHFCECVLGEMWRLSKFSWRSLTFDKLYEDDELGCSHSWWAASSGVIRLVGSHSRQRDTKWMNCVSEQRNACTKDLLAGLRFLPFELVMQRGFPRESKNNRRLTALAMTSSGGSPFTSIMHANCSTSFSPGNIGYPVYNSASIQPTMKDND